MTRLPTPIVKATSAAIFTAVIASPSHEVRLRRCEQRRQEHERDDGEQILDDKPSDGDVSGRRMQVAVVRQDANEHHRAGHGQGHAEDDARGPAPSERRRDHRAQERGHGTLRNRTRYRHATNGEEFLDVKLQTDAEHQEDDANLRKLFRDVRVRHEPGRVGADQDARKQVADERRQPEPLRDVPEEQRGAEATREREDQVKVVHLAGRLSLPASCGTGGVLSREFGVNSVESVAEVVRRNQKTQLCPAEHAVRRFFGSRIEGIEWLPNRGRERGCRMPVAGASAG